eukprot:gnl/TRDRNA2_/TRDRNA2_174085_c0_seq4.p1 gnl/TRDRNA2_/TRDRNA2_174085_c0~~gnl/TRDRNA2_/TRDRNA2_174085_c0_seq4.p1  ORF type:complete len:185 (+),score=31.97 gnl/TRDRNA2_/TRDRNA2_174085_c0_seq4:480-1034(+)
MAHSSRASKRSLTNSRRSQMSVTFAEFPPRRRSTASSISAKLSLRMRLSFHDGERKERRIRRLSFAEILEAVLRLRGGNSAKVTDICDLREFVRLRFDALEECAITADRLRTVASPGSSQPETGNTCGCGMVAARLAELCEGQSVLREGQSALREELRDVREELRILRQLTGIGNFPNIPSGAQ